MFSGLGIPTVRLNLLDCTEPRINNSFLRHLQIIRHTLFIFSSIDDGFIPTKLVHEVGFGIRAVLPPHIDLGPRNKDGVILNCWDGSRPSHDLPCSDPQVICACVCESMLSRLNYSRLNYCSFELLFVLTTARVVPVSS